MSVTSHHLDATSDSVYRELDDVLDACTTLARRPQSAAEFYQTLAPLIYTALSAESVCVWQSDDPRRQRAMAAVGRVAQPDATLTRERLEQVLADAPRDRISEANTANGSHVFVLPVSPRDWLGEGWDSNAMTSDRNWSHIAIEVGGDLPPSTYLATFDFCMTLANIAAEFHARLQFANRQSEQREFGQLAAIAQHAGSTLDLEKVTSIIANEGRRQLGECDRLSVFTVTGGRARLASTSGLDRVDRRSRAVADMQRLATKCLRWNAPLVFGEACDDSPPELTDELAQYADRHDVRHLVLVPITLHRAEGDAATLGLLLAEQFTATPIARDRVQELATVVAPAMLAASTLSRIPLAQSLAKLSVLARPRVATKLLMVAALIVGVLATLIFVERPFRIRATGELVPVERSQVFAPHDGIVERVVVEHGSVVAEDDVLLVLKDPELDLAESELVGERATLTSQLASLRATRLGLAGDRENNVARYRLSAEEATIELKLASLAEREKLLASQRESLTVRSPRAGQILTWQVADRLARRPVERGQALLLVADTEAGWQLHIDVPDDRIGYVEQAIAANRLTIDYQLAAANGQHDQQFSKATLVSLAERASEHEDSLGNTNTTIELVAAPVDDTRAELQTAALRPGGSLRARLDCGERSLGFVLFHELGRRIRDWWSL